MASTRDVLIVKPLFCRWIVTKMKINLRMKIAVVWGILATMEGVYLGIFTLIKIPRCGERLASKPEGPGSSQKFTRGQQNKIKIGIDLK